MSGLLDLRKQRIFAYLDGKAWVTLDELAAEAMITRALAASELSRLGWEKRTPRGDYRPHYFNPGWARRP